MQLWGGFGWAFTLSVITSNRSELRLEGIRGVRIPDCCSSVAILSGNWRKASLITGYGFCEILSWLMMLLIALENEGVSFIITNGDGWVLDIGFWLESGSNWSSSSSVNVELSTLCFSMRCYISVMVLDILFWSTSWCLSIFLQSSRLRTSPFRRAAI